MSTVPGSAQDRPDSERPEPAKSRFSALPPVIDPDDLVEEIAPVRPTEGPVIPDDSDVHWGG